MPTPIDAARKLIADRPSAIEAETVRLERALKSTRDGSVPAPSRPSRQPVRANANVGRMRREASAANSCLRRSEPSQAPDPPSSPPRSPSCGGVAEKAVGSTRFTVSS